MTLHEQLYEERKAEHDAFVEEYQAERAPIYAHIEVEEIERRIATIDNRLEWLAPHVDEAKRLKAERAELEKQRR